MGSLTDKVKGAVKETLGKAVGNKELETVGKLDQAKGSAKEAFENVKQGAQRAVADAKDAVADRARAHAEKAERKTQPE